MKKPAIKRAVQAAVKACAKTSSSPSRAQDAQPAWPAQGQAATETNAARPAQGQAAPEPNGGWPAQGQNRTEAEGDASGSGGEAPTVKVEIVSCQKTPRGQAKAQAGNLPAIPQKEAVQMNYKLKALAAKGDTDLAKQFASCKTQQEKRAFFYNVYVLDPKVSSKKVAKRDVEEDNDIENEEEGWWTAEVIAEWKGIKPGCSNYEAKVQAAVEGLNERDHEDKALAKLGVKQYEYTHRSKKKVKKKRMLELEENVEDVSQEDFSAMRAAMHKGMEQKMISNSSSSKPTKGGLDKAKAAEEAEVDLEIDWCQNLKDQYKKSKPQIAQVSSELHTVEVYKGKVEAVANSEMKSAVLKGIEGMAKDLLARKTAFLAEQLKFPKQLDDLAEAEVKSKEIKAWNGKVQEELKKFRKEFAKHKKFAGD